MIERDSKGRFKPKTKPAEPAEPADNRPKTSARQIIWIFVFTVLIALGSNFVVWTPKIFKPIPPPDAIDGPPLELLTESLERYHDTRNGGVSREESFEAFWLGCAFLFKDAENLRPPDPEAAPPEVSCTHDTCPATPPVRLMTPPARRGLFR